MSIAAEELMDQLNIKPESKAAEELDLALGFHSVLGADPCFPWAEQMMLKCRKTLGAKCVETFDSLLFGIVKKLAQNITPCYSKPYEAAELKTVVSYVLLYFDLVHQDLKAEYMDDNDAYLYLMSDLVSFYLDLEIKSSSCSAYSLKKIGQSMTSALYTHLGESEEHLLDALLKTKLITKHVSELCAPVILKVLTESRCFIGDEHAYIRFILTFKLLHQISRRNQRPGIIRMAVRKLDPAPELVEIVRKMNHIFPTQKKANEPMTLFLMNTKFNFAKAKQEFLKLTTINDGNLIKFYSKSKCGKVIDLLKNKKNVSVINPIPNPTPTKYLVKENYKSFGVELDPSSYRLRSYKDGKEEEKEKEKENGNENENENKIENDNENEHENEMDNEGENEKENRNKKGKTKREHKLEALGNKQKKKTVKEGKKKLLSSDKPNKYDCSEVECLGFQNKANKKVVVITLDSDEDIRGGKEHAKNTNDSFSLLRITKSEVKMPAENIEDLKEKNDDENMNGDAENRLLPMEQGQNGLSASDSVKAEINLNKIISTVPESDKCPIEGIYKEKSSTKRDGEELSAILQSPGHGVIDSTSNSTGSMFDGNFSKDKTYEYQSSSLWDEGRIEVSSSLDFIDSTAGQINDDYTKTKDSEISSTFLLNDCFAFFSNDDYKSSTSNSSEPVNALVQSCKYSIVPTLSESDGLTENTCKKKLGSSLIEVSNYNLDTDNTHDPEDSELQSTVLNRKRLANISDKECDSQENNLNFSDMGILEPGYECILNYQNQSQTENLKQESSNETEFNPKNLAITLKNLEHLIHAPAKKVNYENVAKSYKIVKSNRLKSSSVKSSTPSNRIPASDPSMNSSIQNPCRSSPKFIKIDESSVIVNNMKFVTKNLDGQTSQMFQNESECSSNETKLASNISVAITDRVPLTMNLEGNMQKGIANNGSQSSLANEPSVKMFKKVMGNLVLPTVERAYSEGSVSGSGQYIRMQKPDNPTASRSTLKIHDKTEQTYSKKRRSHAKSVIKTDINMKSILKHINPSSIPQFAAETVKDNKRKYPEGLQQGESGKNGQGRKILRMANNASETKNDLRLLNPCQFLLNPNLPGDLNHFQNNCKIGTEETLTNQGCLPNEPFMAQSTYYDPNKDNVNASFVSISQADTTVHNVDVEFLVDNVHHFPEAYANEIVPPYSKSLNTMSYMPEASEMRNDGIQSNTLGYDGRYLGNFRIAPSVNANGKLNASNSTLLSEASGINAVDQKSLLKFHPGYINTPEQYPIINCKGTDVTGVNKFMEKDMKSIIKNDVNEVNDGEKSDMAGYSRYENHGWTSSMEVGLTFSRLRSPPKSEVNAPRDVIISETSALDLKDEEMGEFVEPWEEPRDYLPSDEEYFKRGLPDPQNLFSEDDLLTHFDKLFPFPNLGRDTLKMEDIDFEAFDKCLCDSREQELGEPSLLNIFNENFTEENRQKLPENEARAQEDTKHKEEQHSQCFDLSNEAQAVTSNESRKNFLGRLRYRRGNVYDNFIEVKSVLNYINRKTLCISKAVSKIGHLESANTCACFRCSYRQMWIRYNTFKLRAMRLRVLNRLHEADRLKSEDDELLRRIEESLKRRDVNLGSGQSSSSLPLKKRFKNFNTVESDSYCSPHATPLTYEKFPSYPTRPMISIAEVQMSLLKNKEFGFDPNGRKFEVERKPERRSVSCFKVPVPPLKPFNPSKNRTDKPGKLGEVQETAVLAQINSQAKQQEPSVNAEKILISPSETENRQPHTLNSFGEIAMGREGEEIIPVIATNKKTDDCKTFLKKKMPKNTVQERKPKPKRTPKARRKTTRNIGLHTKKVASGKVSTNIPTSDSVAYYTRSLSKMIGFTVINSMS